MVMYANEFETKENQKLTEIKNILQHIQVNDFNTTTLLTTTLIINGCIRVSFEFFFLF